MRRVLSETYERFLSRLARAGLPLLAIVTLSGCGLLLDPDPPLPSYPPAATGYECSAQIYRTLGDSGEEFTERWEAWVFANDRNGDGIVDLSDGFALCDEKLGEYVARAEAPGFDWRTRDFRVVEGGPMRASASECADDTAGPPFTTGGPLGAAVTLDPPSPSQVGIEATLFFGGDRFDAEPNTLRFVTSFAERYGLRRLLPPPTGDVYAHYGRHLRFSDVLIEVEPFTLGPLRVNQLYLQSVGTLYAPGEGDTPDPDLYSFRDDALALDGSRQPGKLYFRARGTVEGESETTSFCASGTTFFRESQGSSPQLELEFLETFAGLGASVAVRVTIDLGAFAQQQPYVALADRDSSSLVVSVGNDAGSTILDNDSDLTRCLWFRDFEQATEEFLGVGMPDLHGLRFAPSPVDETGRVTPYELVAACYDSRGAYNVDLQRLYVRTPRANDDAYHTREDAVLEVDAGQSVLLNDDAAGVARVAVRETPPAHGTLDFRSDGTFTYTPTPNFFGEDTFTYVVDHDGLATTDPASVTIFVEEVPTEEEIGELADDLPGIVGSELTAGQVNSLVQKLEQARAELERDGPSAMTSTCNKLSAFINEVMSLVDTGELSVATGTELIARANNIRDELGCS